MGQNKGYKDRYGKYMTRIFAFFFTDLLKIGRTYVKVNN
jgi:hypothetical protein